MAVLLKDLSFLRRQESSKLKASTLIEVLVASVLIIIVFTIASLTLNNVFRSTIKNNTHAIDTHINKLIYLYQHDKIGAEYQKNFKDWSISFSKQIENNTILIVATETQEPNNALPFGDASGKKSRKKKTISKTLIYKNAQ